MLAGENQLTSLVKSKIRNIIRISKTFELTSKICLIRYIRVSIHMHHYSYPLIINKKNRHADIADLADIH